MQVAEVVVVGGVDFDERSVWAFDVGEEEVRSELRDRREELRFMSSCF